MPAVNADRLLAVCRDQVKASLFSEIAIEMAKGVPKSGAFAWERELWLGATSGAPVELAVSFGNVPFVALDPVQAYVGDIWGHGSVSPKRILHQLLHPWKEMCSSVRLRYLSSFLSNLLFAGLVWANAYNFRLKYMAPNHAGVSFAAVEVALAVSGASNVADEVADLLSEMHMQLKANPRMSMHEAVVSGFVQYIQADTWHVIDLVSAALFVVTMGFRIAGMWWQYNVRDSGPGLGGGAGKRCGLELPSRVCAVASRLW